MLTLKLTVSYVDGRPPQVVDILPASQVAFERHFSCAFSKAFGDSPQFEHLYFLAWHASRSGMEFDPWLDIVAGVDTGEVKTVDPTEKVPSEGS